MDEDLMMVDQAMDTDSNAPPVPSADSTSAVASRGSLPAHRHSSNPDEKRGNHGSLKIHSGAGVQKALSNPKTTRHNYSFREQKQAMIRRTLRMQRIQRAIADGSYQMRASDPQGDGSSTANQDQGELEQIQRLDQNLLTAALFEPVPGMTFDPAAPWAFSNEADMQDLIQSLQAFQMHLARKGQVVMSHRSGPLLRGFARDVLATVLLRQARPGFDIGVVDFWTQVALDYERSKKVKWLAARVMQSMQSLRPINGRTSFRTCAKMVLEALEAPGKHPQIDQAIAAAINDMPPFILAQPSTLRALMGHFEAARARYLANLKAADGAHTPSMPEFPKHATGSENWRQGDGQDDSSEDEDDGLRGGVCDGGADDEGQVEGGVPSELTQWFLVKLDKWTASKNEQQQEGVDVDMLSALDLGEAKRNHGVM